MVRIARGGNARTGSSHPVPERDEHMRDGSPIHLRMIRPEDAPRLVDLHESLSPYSVYLRFFTAHPHLAVDEIRRFTCVDGTERVAYIAEDDDRLVGVGRYDRLPGTDEAEVAFVVADDHQRRGIGTLLLEVLADVARERGISTFVAVTLAENPNMIDVLMHSGFDAVSSFHDGELAIRFPLAPVPSVRHCPNRAPRGSGP